jgi:hypothetical protein
MCHFVTFSLFRLQNYNILTKPPNFLSLFLPPTPFLVSFAKAGKIIGRMLRVLGFFLLTLQPQIEY